MNLKKKGFIFFLAVLLLYGACFGAEAIWGPYVNDENSTYDGLVIGAYAVGASGVDMITEHLVYALTAGGPVLLNTLGNSEEKDEDAEGGGGLVYENGSVRVFADRVRAL